MIKVMWLRNCGDAIKMVEMVGTVCQGSDSKNKRGAGKGEETVRKRKRNERRIGQERQEERVTPSFWTDDVER